MSKLLPYIGNPNVLAHILNPATPINPENNCAWNPSENANTFNIKSLTEAIDIIKRGKPQDANIFDIAKVLTSSKRDRLWRWNRFNHIFESGRLIVKGQPIFVGSKINLPDEQVVAVDSDRSTIKRYQGMNFYCMGVGHSYQFGEGWNTSLSLARGRNEDHLKDYANLRKFNLPIGSGNHIYAGTGDKL
jgi:hypothetical protein